MLVLQRLWVDTDGILLGCEVYSEHSEIVKKSFNRDANGYEIMEDIHTIPKEEVILTPEELSVNCKMGHELTNSKGDYIQMSSYETENNIGEIIVRYEPVYIKSGKKIMEIKRDRYVPKSVVSVDDISRKDINYLVEGYFKYNRYVLEVI